MRSNGPDGGCQFAGSDASLPRAITSSFSTHASTPAVVSAHEYELPQVREPERIAPNALVGLRSWWHVAVPSLRSRQGPRSWHQLTTAPSGGASTLRLPPKHVRVSSIFCAHVIQHPVMTCLNLPLGTVPSSKIGFG